MKKIFFVVLVFITSACKEIYVSPFQSPETGFLVVEGAIISGQGTTTIKLSRTTKLDIRKFEVELGAILTVEGDDNSLYILFEKGNGHYEGIDLNLNNTHKYRLRIKTTAGKEYLSDFSVVKNNPPIEDVSWKRENGGVQLYISTNDPQNNTRYYQWEYTETWEFHSAYPSYLKYKTQSIPGGDTYEVVFKDSTTFSFDPTIYTCWKSNASTNLLIGSSARLSRDAIYLPLTFIPPFSQQIGILYSINVKQYSWSKEGYEFLERMKKNTEGTGSVFDAQPSELKGNIYCITDPAEPVIGFVNICKAQEKRIFIRPSEVPGWNYNDGCRFFEIENQSDSIRLKGLGLMPAYVAKTSPFGGAILSFIASIPDCVDCPLTGTNRKPVFWP